MSTRRVFLGASFGSILPGLTQDPLPWYRRTLRWGQTNITERDPDRYDLDFWTAHWKRTRVQGVIVNAGGIVAYYPSRYPLHEPAAFLKGRDTYGDVVRAARASGLVVLARMDSNRASEKLYRAYPDWFAMDSSGRPYRAEDKFITCINGPYYSQWIPGILREIIERSRPDGFTDNSWAGLGRDSICHCRNCKEKFGRPLPQRKDWDDPLYREWIRWNYARRVALWDENNKVTRDAGGPHCLWVGMTSGSVSGMARSFRDLKSLAERAGMILLDHQRREDAMGFQQNTETGLRVHGVGGWDKLAPESMAMYQSAPNSFRLSAKPPEEARMWMLAGFAGGIQPWWHHIAAFHEDRRAYATAEPLMRWHEANQEFLIHRTPVAMAGIVWSQENTDYFGRDDAEDFVDAPYRGIQEVLLRARIPAIPVHADHISREAGKLPVLILPHTAVLSGSQCEAILRFVRNGGGLLATGPVALMDETGSLAPNRNIANLLGVQEIGWDRKEALGSTHSYLRIEKSASAHPAFEGFSETQILPFGGRLGNLTPLPDAKVLATYIPPFPVYPPETSWMREPETRILAMVVREEGKGRVAYCPAGLDRRYAKDHLPDHARLLRNLVRWVGRNQSILQVDGPGLLQCSLYQQGYRHILHLLNLTNEASWRAPIEESLTIGPYQVSVLRRSTRRARLLVANRDVPVQAKNGWVSIVVPSIAAHEVLVLE